MSTLLVRTPDGDFVEIPSLQGSPGKDAPQESILYVPQDLTEEQKEQARANIDVPDNEDVAHAIEEAMSDLGGTVEVTSGLPQKEQTVLTVDPEADVVNLYTAEEIDAQMREKQPTGDYALRSEVPVVDNTLSVEGAAADAKATKTKINSLAVAVDNMLAGKQPKGDYALKSEVPNIPETTESDMYLVTDNEGNRVWAKQLAYVRQEEQALLNEIEITDTNTTMSGDLLIQLIPFKEGDVVRITFNGVTYEKNPLSMGSGRFNVTIQSVCRIIFTGVGSTCTYSNLSGQTGTLSATVITDKYYTIDPKFMPMAAKAGNGYNSVILTPYEPGVVNTAADNSYSVSANHGRAHGAFAFAVNSSEANGDMSFSAGRQTVTNARYSFVSGYSTIASSEAQHVEGKYNIEDTEEKYAHIIGNGTAEDARSNAHTVGWEGTGWFAKGLKVGGTGQDDESAQEVALKSEIPEPYTLPTASDSVKGGMMINPNDFMMNGDVLGLAKGKLEVVDEFTLENVTTGLHARTTMADGTPYNFKIISTLIEYQFGDTVPTIVDVRHQVNGVARQVAAYNTSSGGYKTDDVNKSLFAKTIGFCANCTHMDLSSYPLSTSQSFLMSAKLPSTSFEDLYTDDPRFTGIELMVYGTVPKINVKVMGVRNNV